MQLWQDYHTPTTVDDALALLSNYAGEARIIAGGTDLLIDLQFSHSQPHTMREPMAALVDVTRISEMTRIEQRDDLCYIGGAATHTSIVKSALLEARATCIVESCGVVGGPQVRNVGTLGGNVAHALPAGDGTTSLVALDAEVEIAWHDDRGREWLPIATAYRGPGISALDSSRDVLVGFRFKLTGEREGAAFKRIMRPQGVALPVLGCAVWVRLDESREHYEDVRISINPVAPLPSRATEVEAAL
ncbi:MAG: FAD binding domain-containing protein, partial [Burkholderiales bacterium]|nr:FAD binding domain-containing protein [Anaerolineae bacterium]